MKCPICGFDESKVLETRSVDGADTIRRRRECGACQHRFTTYEVLEEPELMVCKRDNTRETFDRNKILNGLLKACRKRPVSIRQMEALVGSMETEFQNTMRTEVSTTEIGERIMAGLKLLDEVAYIRFVSVYRDFDDIDSFFDELNRLKRDREARQK